MCTEVERKEFRGRERSGAKTKQEKKRLMDIVVDHEKDRSSAVCTELNSGLIELVWSFFTKGYSVLMCLKVEIL